jgi:hypothetical protein
MMAKRSYLRRQLNGFASLMATRLFRWNSTTDIIQPVDEAGFVTGDAPVAQGQKDNETLKTWRNPASPACSSVSSSIRHISPKSVLCFRRECDDSALRDRAFSLCAKPIVGLHRVIAIAV